MELGATSLWCDNGMTLCLMESEDGASAVIQICGKGLECGVYGSEQVDFDEESVRVIRSWLGRWLRSRKLATSENGGL